MIHCSGTVAEPTTHYATLAGSSLGLIIISLRSVSSDQSHASSDSAVAPPPLPVFITQLIHRDGIPFSSMILIAMDHSPASDSCTPRSTRRCVPPASSPFSSTSSKACACTVGAKATFVFCVSEYVVFGAELDLRSSASGDAASDSATPERSSTRAAYVAAKAAREEDSVGGGRVGAGLARRVAGGPRAKSDASVTSSTPPGERGDAAPAADAGDAAFAACARL